MDVNTGPVRSPGEPATDRRTRTVPGHSVASDGCASPGPFRSSVFRDGRSGERATTKRTDVHARGHLGGRCSYHLDELESHECW
jgi:hypothetical protein